MSPRRLRRLLERELGYAEVPGSSRSGGSHVKLCAEGRITLVWGFHDTGRELAPNEVKKVLVTQVGLTLEEAGGVVRRG